MKNPFSFSSETTGDSLLALASPGRRDFLRQIVKGGRTAAEIAMAAASYKMVAGAAAFGTALLNAREALAATIEAVTDQNFEQKVIEASRKQPVVVQFWAAWCLPCRAYTPVFSKVAGSRNDAAFATCDQAHNPNFFAHALGKSLPYTALYRNGQLERSAPGLLSEQELIDFIEGRYNPKPERGAPATAGSGQPGSTPGGGAPSVTPAQQAKLQAQLNQALQNGHQLISEPAWNSLQAGDEIYGFNSSGGQVTIKVLKSVKSGDTSYAAVTQPNSDTPDGAYNWEQFMNTHQGWVVGGVVRKKGTPPLSSF